MPAGRPKKTLETVIEKQELREDWKEHILFLMSQGYSDVEVRVELSKDMNNKFSHNLWYTLQERNEEFLETIQIGKVLCQAWWESQGRISLRAKTFNTGLWYANMKNRFGWKDKQHVESDNNVNLTITDFIREVENRRKDFSVN